MIGYELILLGLLKESPKHGYEIKKKIKEILFLFAGIDLKSIYYPLMVLEKKGMVVKHADKQGRRPERFIYALTEKGEVRFTELLNKSFLDFKRPEFSLDLSLFFLNYIKPEIAKRRLCARTLILKKLAKTLKSMHGSLSNNKSLPLSRILEHNVQMVETEARFLSLLVKKI